MINKKKLGIFGASAAMLIASAASLASCGGTAADLTYWCPANDTEIMAEFVADFKAANPSYASKNIQLLANFGEDQAVAQLQKNLNDAADVMLVADDTLRSAVKSADVQAWDSSDKASFVASDGQDAVDALSIGGTMYALPYRGDNSPMLIYDSSIVSADEVTTLEGIVAAAKNANAKVYMDLANGWYNPFLLWGGDATIEVVTKDGEDLLYTDAATSKVTSTAAFCDAFYEFRGLAGDTFVSSSDQGAIEAGFQGKTIAAAFFWNDLATIRATNADAKVATWPTFGGKQLECFASYKGVVVKAEIDDSNGRRTLAKDFAKFLANKDCQIKRAKQLSYGPSNLEAKQDDAVKALEWVSCIGEMVDGGYTHPQAQSTTGNFWTPIGDFGKMIATQNWGTFGSAKRALEALAGNTGWTTSK